MQRLKIALPDELRAQLDAASAKSGQSVAEEIRRRVEMTFALESADQRTRELADDIVALADGLRRLKGVHWYTHEKAREALLEAIKEWFAGFKRPRGLRSSARSVPGVSDLFWGQDDPATLGRAVARHWLLVKAEIEKSTVEMRKLQEGEKS